MLNLGMAAVLAVAAIVVPSFAHAQRAQPTLLPEPHLVQPLSARAELAASPLEQQRDTTRARRTPIFDRLSPDQQIGLAGLVVASTTLIVANNARARDPVRSGFAIDQRSLVAAGAIIGATVTAIWLERRRRDARSDEDRAFSNAFDEQRDAH